MTHAYSRLKQVLDERQMSVPELHRRHQQTRDADQPQESLSSQL